jgi:hypothetical protein
MEIDAAYKPNSWKAELVEPIQVKFVNPSWAPNLLPCGVLLVAGCGSIPRLLKFVAVSFLVIYWV